MAPLTVTLIVDPEAFMIPASVVVSTPEVPNGNDVALTPAAPAAAEATPEEDDEVEEDDVPVEVVTVGTEIVGTDIEADGLLGMLTLGTLIDGAEICETLGKNGIEL